MSNTRAINQVIAGIDSNFIRALAEPVRLDILRLLLIHGASDVSSLAAKLPQDRSVISRHLSTLHKAGILHSHKQGRHVVYEIDGETTVRKAEALTDAMRRCLSLGCC